MRHVALARILAVMFFGVLLSGCSHSIKPEDKPNLAVEERLDALPQRPKKRKATPPKNALPSYLQQKVSVQLSESMPIKDALVELARQAKINLAVAKGVAGGVTFSCRDCPLHAVIDNICKLGGLRARHDTSTLYLEQDTPYFVNYDAHFLAHIRQSESHFSVNTEVFSTRQASPGLEGEGGNKNIISGQTKNDFWQDLEGNLKAILQEPLGQTKSNPLSAITFHRQAGLISIFATSSQHALINAFLQRLKKMSTTQVLIEAKIVEVSLKREYQSGIDWNVHGFSMNSAGMITAPGSSTTSLVNIALKGKNFSSTLKFLETFGKTRTLSSPRLTVLNNQPAIFKVAENKVYFRLRYERLERSKDMGGDLVSTTSDIHTMPLGLILSVQPSINAGEGTITLALRPTITSSKESVDDPAVAIASQNAVKSSVPIVEVRELDSVLHVLSGQPIVLGGLMQERSREKTSGLPGTTRAPVLKTLFGTSDMQDHEVVELVIFLRAHILDQDDDLSDEVSWLPPEKSLENTGVASKSVEAPHA